MFLIYIACVVCPMQADHLEKQWSGMTQASSTVTTWDTGVDEQLLRFVSAKSVDVPADFVRF